MPLDVTRGSAVNLYSRFGRRPLVLAAAALLILVALILAGYLAYRDMWTRPVAPTEKLVLAVPMLPHTSLLLIAEVNGYFVEEGLEVVIKPVSHGKIGLDMVVQGQADLAGAAEQPFVIEVMNGAQLAMVAKVASVADEIALVARADRGITTVRDLVGKRIGVTLRTSGDYSLWLLMIKNRIAPEGVTLIDLPPAALVPEILRGSIDALSAWEPIKSDAFAALSGNAVTFTDPDTYTVAHILFGRTEFLKAHPVALQKMLRALLKAEDFTRADPRTALAVVAKRLGMEVDRLAPSWTQFLFKIDLTQSMLVTLEEESRWAVARGYAKSPAAPLNFLPNLHLDAMLAVRPDRVSVVH